MTWSMLNAQSCRSSNELSFTHRRQFCRSRWRRVALDAAPVSAAGAGAGADAGAGAEADFLPFFVLAAPAAFARAAAGRSQDSALPPER